MEGGSMIYLGIDNGISGGLAALSETAGAGIIAMCAMPVHKVTGHSIGKERRVSNEVDVGKMVRWIAETIHNHDTTFVIEECPGHANRASTMRSMATSYGLITGAIAAALPWCRIVRVRSGNPKDSWQNMLDCKRGEEKPAALKLAKALWPRETWLASKLCKTPHDGMIDAALIAEFARRKNL
jgi:hypothetical protein